MKQQRKRSSRSQTSLAGQLLIAMPTMSDKRFRRSVIYMCAHGSEGAMGLIINRQSTEVTFRDLLTHLNLARVDEEVSSGDLGVMIGGPVSTESGFVLHTDDYHSEGITRSIADGICLTATLDILSAIARGKGPSRAMLALGYSGWAPGQLDAEIAANVWLHSGANRDLLFGTAHEEKYERALAILGIDLSNLVTVAGRA